MSSATDRQRWRSTVAALGYLILQNPQPGLPHRRVAAAALALQADSSRSVPPKPLIGQMIHCRLVARSGSARPG